MSKIKYICIYKDFGVLTEGEEFNYVLRFFIYIIYILICCVYYIRQIIMQSILYAS